MESIMKAHKCIAAFVKDMEDLGVDVDLGFIGDLTLELKPGVTVLAVIRIRLDEEAEGR